MYNKGEELKIAKLKGLFMGILVLVALALIMGFHSKSNADDKNVITAVLHSALKTLDPHNNTTLIAQTHGFMVYDTLFSMDEKFEIRPQMVETWQVSNDKLTYTFKLRDGLRWHDGKPVTSADVIASIRRWGQNDSIGQSLIKATSKFVAVDNKTFQIILSEPFGLVIYALGKTPPNTPFIMPERVAAKVPASEQVTDYTGSGPFIFVKDEFKPGAQTVYVKNESYLPRKEPPSSVAGGKVVNLKRVVWKVIPDITTAVNALKAGEIDFLEYAPNDLMPILAADKNITIEVLQTTGRQGMLRMNWLQPPFNNEKIRRAVGYAINQEDCLRAAVGDPNYYRVCKAMFGCGTPLATEAGSEGLMVGDIGKAKELLKEGGYDGTPVLIMNPTENPALSAPTLVIAQALRKAGMNVNVQAMDWGTLANRRSNSGPPSEGGWNIFLTTWAGIDISNPVITRHLTATGLKGSWFGWPEDKKLMELISAFLKAEDSINQKKLAAQIQARAYEVGTHYLWGEFLQPCAYRSNLRGLLKAPASLFWNLKKQ
jgi:peptide/nickel transport system substrate-binding protein